MKTMTRVACALLIATSVTSIEAQDESALSIYLVDVEGGNATLFVSPSGESMLMDTGNGGANADRDVGRIMEAIEDAGLRQIDHLITTHWHGDHYGGLSELATRIPIRHYIDHGPTVEDNETVLTFLDGPYPDLYGASRRTVVAPGDRIPLRGVEVQVAEENLVGGLAAHLPGQGFVLASRSTGHAFGASGRRSRGEIHAVGAPEAAKAR